MTSQRMLIVDDELELLEGLQRVLAFELAAVQIDISTSPLAALDSLRRQPYDLVLLDLRMPDMDGMALMEAVQSLDEPPTVIMMSAYGDIETAVAAIKKGAYDFITKPFEIADLVRTLKKGLERSRLIDENRSLRQQVFARTAFERYVGRSAPVQRLYEVITSVANTDYAVLIRGESGTGKELVARAIHTMSKRGTTPLVAVNCPAIPEHLLESELFGHQKGAFTGAIANRKGLFEEAHRSSLLLDEIADIPVTVQTKLLRVLQEQEIRPLGSTRGFHVDVRILSTTNQNLEEKIKERSFREDLYYRLNVVTIRTPNLREMREDIPLLIKHFAGKTCQELEIAIKGIAPDVLTRLTEREWPGNIRELQNFVRRLVVFSTAETIDEKALQDASNQFGSLSERTGETADPSDDRITAYTLEKNKVVHDFTVEYIDKLLRKTNGNVSRAALAADLSRQALQKILQRTGIDPEPYRHDASNG